MNMKKVIMMFALMTGTISAFAQNADSTSVESDNTAPVLTGEVYPQKEADGDLYHGLTRKLTFDRMIPPHGLEVTYGKTVHILFPSEVLSTIEEEYNKHPEFDKDRKSVV